MSPADAAAAVDGQHLPGDVGRIGGEVQAGARDFLAEPARLSAVRWMIFSCSASSSPSSGHMTGPGATALTRTCGPISRARAW